MKHLLIAGGLTVTSFLFPSTAFADHDYEDERCGRYGCNEYRHDYGNRGDNSNGRDRGAFSPDLQDSPVTICMPNSTCHFDGERGREQNR